MIIKKSDELYELAKRIIIKAGGDERNSSIVAEALVSANLRGVDTHGIYRLPFYVDQIKSSLLIPYAWPEIVKEEINSALVKGNWTFGHVTAKFAMEIAIRKAQKNNIAVVSGVQVTHTGRLGEYAEMAACKKMISMMFTGGLGREIPNTVPYGGSKPILHTNPFTIGFPVKNKHPMILDFASAASSDVKIKWAKEKKQNVPMGWICDKDGKPTTNPEEYFALMPFGGHKGYALMLINEFFGRIFTGSDLFVEKDLGHPVFRHSGFTMIVIRPDLFRAFEDYATDIDETEEKIRSVPPAPGFKEVLIPGDIENRTYLERKKNGIPIPDDIWQSVIKLT